MPQHREAPIASSEPTKVSSTEVVSAEVESTPSESESITLSDYDFEVNVVQSPTSSTASDDIILELDSVESGTGFQIPESAPRSPVFELEKFVLPIEYNLRQLLIKVTDTEDLDTVKSIRLRVIARDFSLQRLPTFLPNLKELNLNGSSLMTLRDLGCHMQSLEILHVAKTGINSLDGLFGLQGLVELYAAGNNIRDLSPCASLQDLKVLDLGKNAIMNVDKVAFLELCTGLKHLILMGNPTADIENYRNTVKILLPDLLSLDGEDYIIPITDEDKPHYPKKILEKISSEKIISRFPPIIRKNFVIPSQKVNEVEQNSKLLPKRPNTTGSIPNKEKTKLLPIRPSTARRSSDNDFTCILNGANLRLNDIRSMFVPSKLTSGRPMSGNIALSLWEKKREQAWDEWEDIDD